MGCKSLSADKCSADCPDFMRFFFDGQDLFIFTSDIFHILNTKWTQLAVILSVSNK